MEILKSEEYKSWITEIKERISSAQIKASLSVNSEMLNLYWDLGQSISEKLTTSNWGTKVVENMSRDLQNTFPNIDGFSKRNLLFMRQWFEFYQYFDSKSIEIMKQVVSQLPGKLSFYLSAVDDLLRKENDNPTIGILLCKSKDKIEAEYALRGISQPIGVAEYVLSKAIPDNLRSQLPTIRDIENELNQ